MKIPNTMKVKYYTDPGHGWVAVKRKVLEQFMPYSEVTCFSYVKGKTVYLEEDYDASRDRKSTRLNSSHVSESRMPSSA
mgnify:CR=1 FL=1